MPVNFCLQAAGGWPGDPAVGSLPDLSRLSFTIQRGWDHGRVVPRIKSASTECSWHVTAIAWRQVPSQGWSFEPQPHSRIQGQSGPAFLGV